MFLIYKYPQVKTINDSKILFSAIKKIEEDKLILSTPDHTLRYIKFATNFPEAWNDILNNKYTSIVSLPPHESKIVKSYIPLSV